MILGPGGAGKTTVARELSVLDGNFLETPAGRFERADTVVFLDLPRRLCIWRVLSRRVRDRGRSRPDLPASEGLDLDLLRWIWRYPRTDRPSVLELLASLPRHVTTHHLRTRDDVRAFVVSSHETSSR